MTRPFTKMHGLRNHFVIVDARSEPYAPGAEEVVRVCDVQIGVGAEQLVVLEKASSPEADVFMRLFNVTGLEVGACGNATRCVAWLMLEESKTDTVRIETLAGVLECRRAGEHRVTCDMGAIRSDWQAIPLSEPREIGKINLAGLASGFALNVGNPHLVFFVENADAIDLEAIARQIQSDPLFPESVNVGVAQRLDEGSLYLRVYERGAGLTMACGTGACAAAFAAVAAGNVESKRVLVALPGGEVEIELVEQDHQAVHALMTGPVAYAFRGELKTQ